MAAIEDIDYLWENSEQQSFLLYIDSSLRNRFAYPNPNQYVVEFNNPFRFVFGYEVLDALIPTTMYNVEPFNNTLVLGVMQSTRGAWPIESFDMRVFDDYKYVPEILSFVVDGTPGNLAACFHDALDSMGITYADAPSVDSARIVVVRSFGVSPVDDATFSVPFIDTDGREFFADASAVPALQGTRYVRVHTGVATIASIRYVSQLDFATILQSSLYDIAITNYVITFGVRNYDNRQILTAMNGLLADIGFIATHFSSVPEQANRYRWTNPWPFWINFLASTIQGAMMGFDELAVADRLPGFYTSFPEYIDPQRRLFASVFDDSEQSQSIVSPNMLDIGGPAYVVFRVPELEEHAFAGEGNNANTVQGLGIFKLLSAGGGIQNLRFDFTNLVRKPFHPIGKLSRLTIRMELKNGDLYDFKGVNHNILLVIKYLVPRIKSDVPRYTIGMLNSDYSPDAQGYMLRHRRLLDEMESDSDTDIEAETKEERRIQVPTFHGIRDLVGKYFT